MATLAGEVTQTTKTFRPPYIDVWLEVGQLRMRRYLTLEGYLSVIRVDSARSESWFTALEYLIKQEEALSRYGRGRAHRIRHGEAYL